MNIRNYRFMCGFVASMLLNLIALIFLITALSFNIAKAKSVDASGITRQYVDVVYINETGATIGYRFTDYEQQTVCYVITGGDTRCNDRLLPVYPKPQEKGEGVLYGEYRRTR